jgi:proteasome accessory factor C
VTERPDGSLDVALTVSEPVWLERLLLRLGPDAEVVDPPEWRAAGADTAARVLARYTGVQNR